MKPVRMYTTPICPYCVRAKSLLGACQLGGGSGGASYPASEPDAEFGQARALFGFQ